MNDQQRAQLCVQELNVLIAELEKKWGCSISADTRQGKMGKSTVVEPFINVVAHPIWLPPEEDADDKKDSG